MSIFIYKLWISFWLRLFSFHLANTNQFTSRVDNFQLWHVHNFIWRTQPNGIGKRKKYSTVKFPLHSIESFGVCVCDAQEHESELLWNRQPRAEMNSYCVRPSFSIGQIRDVLALCTVPVHIHTNRIISNCIDLVVSIYIFALILSVFAIFAIHFVKQLRFVSYRIASCRDFHINRAKWSYESNSISHTNTHRTYSLHLYRIQP